MPSFSSREPFLAFVIVASTTARLLRIGSRREANECSVLLNPAFTRGDPETDITGQIFFFFFYFSLFLSTGKLCSPPSPDPWLGIL
jgi:hypothetical protein